MRQLGGSSLVAEPQRGRPPIWDRRLCFVLGKGGVGKSTVAAALGVAHARAGRRTLLVEVISHNRLSRLLVGAGVGSEPVAIAENLHAIAIDPQVATEEYLRGQLKVRALAEVLIHSRAFKGFAAAAPGLAEMITVGKIWTLAVELKPEGDAPVWDRIVVDCAATGHGIAMLETAGNVREIARSGPIHDQADRIQQVISHPAATGVAVVARPDELPVGEAIDAVARLDELGVPVGSAILNAATPLRFDEADERALRGALDRRPTGPGAAAAQAALAELERARHEAGLRERLRVAGLPLLELPLLTRTWGEAEAIGILADRLREQFRAPEPVAP